MSGFEIVGVILGGLPIVVKVAENYKRGVEPIAKWLWYKVKLREFVNNVDVEKQIFTALCSRLLQFTSLSSEDKTVLLQGEDVSGWRRSETEKALERRLGESYDACKSLMAEIHEDLTTLQALLCLKDGTVDWIKPGKDQVQYQWKRISHSFSKKGPKAVDSLRQHNKTLRRLLNTIDEGNEPSAQHRKFYKSNDYTWARVFKSIREHASSLHTALGKGWKCSCLNRHSILLQLEARTTGDWSSRFVINFVEKIHANHEGSITYIPRVFTTVKIPNKLVPNVTSQSTIGPPPAGYLTKLRSNLDQPGEKPGELLIYNEAAFCQNSTTSTTSATTSSLRKSFKLPQRSSLSKGSNNTPDRAESSSTPRKQKKKVQIEDSIPLQRIQSAPALSALSVDLVTNQDRTEITDLCFTLSKSDGNSTYLGYLQGPEDRHHELHCLRSTTKKLTLKTSELINLKSLIDPAESLKLTRKQRFKLTLVLASSLLQLQTTPWFSGILLKEEIFFEYHAADIITKYPYIHHTLSNDPVQEALSSSQICRRTRASLTSLGILLLELLFNSPIEAQHEIRKYHLNDEGLPHNDTDYMTALNWIEDIEEDAGINYKHAVKACFVFDDVKMDWEDPAFITSIYMKVVEELEIVLDGTGWRDDEENEGYV